MFKIARIYDADGRKTAERIMETIRAECPAHWPYGLSLPHFDSGVYLIREKSSSVPVGFCGFQKRAERRNGKVERVGYYSIGILPEHRKSDAKYKPIEEQLQAQVNEGLQLFVKWYGHLWD